MRAGASPGSLPGLLSRALSSPAGFAHGRLRRTLPRTLPRTLQGFLPPPRCNIARNAPGNALRGPKPAAGFTARENVRAAACAFPKRAFAGSLPGSLPREMSPGPGQNAWQCTAEMHWRCRVPENGRAGSAGGLTVRRERRRGGRGQLTRDRSASAVPSCAARWSVRPMGLTSSVTTEESW